MDESFPANVIRFWRVPNRRLSESELPVTEAVSMLRETLVEAARIRTRADVAWGLALSGGMDSSALTAILCELGRPGITSGSPG